MLGNWQIQLAGFELFIEAREKMEQDAQHNGDAVDRIMTRLLMAYCQRGPRRRFLEGIGRCALGILGIQATRVLPVERVLAAGCDCVNDPRWWRVSQT